MKEDLNSVVIDLILKPSFRQKKLKKKRIPNALVYINKNHQFVTPVINVNVIPK